MVSPTPNTSLGPSELWTSPELRRGQALGQRGGSDLWEVGPSLCCWVRVCTTAWTGNCFLGFTTLCDRLYVSPAQVVQGGLVCTPPPCRNVTPANHILLELSLQGPGLCGDIYRMQLSYPWGYTNLNAALFLFLFAKFLLGYCKEQTLQKNLF